MEPKNRNLEPDFWHAKWTKCLPVHYTMEHFCDWREKYNCLASCDNGIWKIIVLAIIWYQNGAKKSKFRTGLLTCKVNQVSACTLHDGTFLWLAWKMQLLGKLCQRNMKNNCFSNYLIPKWSKTNEIYNRTFDMLNTAFDTPQRVPVFSSNDPASRSRQPFERPRRSANRSRPRAPRAPLSPAPAGSRGGGA